MRFHRITARLPFVYMSVVILGLAMITRGQDEAIRVYTDLVTLPVTVHDREQDLGSNMR